MKKNLSEKNLKVIRTIPGYLGMLHRAGIEVDEGYEEWLFFKELDMLKEREEEVRRLNREISVWARQQPEFVDQTKKELDVLFQKLEDVSELYLDLYRNGEWMREIIGEDLKEITKQIKKRMNFLKYKDKPTPKGSVNELMIEQARKYPIENLIETNNAGFALCPFHEDRKPSFYIKNNFGYCFSCKESADPIKLYMTLHNANFIQAVKSLS